MSERVASEVSRVSVTLSERMMTEVEQAIPTHSNSSPATSSEQSRIVEEDTRRLDSKIEVSLRALSFEVKRNLGDG